jgi:hypothetical protein
MIQKIALPALLVAILGLFSACLVFQPKFNPFKAQPVELTKLNSDLTDPEFKPPKEPILITGKVVSIYSGRRYKQVLGLTPLDPNNTEPKEIILCLFEEPFKGPPIEPGQTVSVAGILSRASVSDHLILNFCILLDRTKGN